MEEQGGNRRSVNESNTWAGWGDTWRYSGFFVGRDMDRAVFSVWSLKSLGGCIENYLKQL